MAGVFISYRVDDAKPWAFMLREELAAAFGEEQVFLDKDTLQAGNWRSQIRHALDRCEVVLVVMGKRWLSLADEQGVRRLDKSDDVHRQEIAYALSRADVTVIPIRVDGAQAPLAEELPDDIRALCDQQMRDISDKSAYRQLDLALLIDDIERVTGLAAVRPASKAAPDAETRADAILRRNPRLNYLVGWASVAALVLGLTSQIAGHIEQPRQALFDYLGIDTLVFVHHAMSVLVTALFAAGYIFGWLWIYKRHVAHLQFARRKAVAVIGALTVVMLTGVSSYATLPGVPDVEKPLLHISAEWSKELLALIDPEGGLKTSRGDPTAPRQVWSTAQSLVAVLSGPVTLTADQAKQIRRHFEFFEKARLPGDEGWGYMEPIDWGVTEINAWVALAYMASLTPDVHALIWRPESPGVAETRLLRELESLKRRQHPNGSWSPIRRTDIAGASRTYSTIMAVWALVEARKLKILKDAEQPAHDQAIQNAIRWLLTTYNADRQSWVPNPERKRQLDSFPGLSAQVLFVLSKAQPDFGYLLDGDETYKRAGLAFLSATQGSTTERAHDPRRRSVSNNDRTHDSDRYLWRSPYMVEGSTFLWFPWSLAYCAQCLEKSPAEVKVQNAARGICKLLLGRVNESIGFAKSDPFAYVMAESLLAINLYLRSAGAVPASKGSLDAAVPVSTRRTNAD